MNPKTKTERSQKRVWFYVLAYLAWFGSIAFSGFILLLLHSVFSQWYFVLGLRASAYRFSSQFFMIIGGIVWLVFIFFTDSYLIDGVAKNVFWHRLLIIFSALSLVTLFAGALYVLIGPYLGVNP